MRVCFAAVTTVSIDKIILLYTLLYHECILCFLWPARHYSRQASALRGCSIYFFCSCHGRKKKIKIILEVLVYLGHRAYHSTIASSQVYVGVGILYTYEKAV